MTNDTCPSCGASIDDASLKFCTSCGLRLVPDSDVGPAEPATGFIQPPPASVATVELATNEAAPELSNSEPTPVVDVSEVVIRRTRTSPFLPPPLPDEEQTPIISRAWAGSRNSGRKAQLTRERKMAGGLPDWEPLPPGELLVKRAKRK